MNNNIDKLVDSILYKHSIEEAKKKFKKRNAIVANAPYGKLFVDDKTGECYLFDEDGNLDDINKVTYLTCNAFDGCKSLKSIKIPNSVKAINSSAFTYCESLTNIEIPDSVKIIRDSAFENCTTLKSIKIPDLVEIIGYRAFQDCTSLTSIEIPDSVESIGCWAFEKCTSLKEVIFKGKTLDQIKAMHGYPWEIEDESVIKCLD